jgi:hypothetical protein
MTSIKPNGRGVIGNDLEPDVRRLFSSPVFNRFHQLVTQSAPAKALTDPQ